jgi:hypothetical protein
MLGWFIDDLARHLNPIIAAPQRLTGLWREAAARGVLGARWRMVGIVRESFGNSAAIPASSGKITPFHF